MIMKQLSAWNILNIWNKCTEMYTFSIFKSRIFGLHPKSKFNFSGATTLFSTVAIPSYFNTNNSKDNKFSHLHQHLLFSIFKIKASLVSRKWPFTMICTVFAIPWLLIILNIYLCPYWLLWLDTMLWFQVLES